MIETLATAFAALLTVEIALAMVVGTVAGIVVGALPGLTTSVGLAVLIPLTFGMNPLVALGLMAGLYNGSMYGGAIPAILLNIPGTPAAIATTFDGYPMAQQGRSAAALRIACYSSAVGGMVSALSLILLAPPLAKVTLAFGPAEYFWVAMVGLVSVSVLLGADPLKGLISAALGLLVATVGMDTLTGRMRFTFGTLELVDGISITVLLVGLFALPRVFMMAEEGRTTGVSAAALSIGGHGLTRRAVLDLVPTWLRAGVIGIIVGILPGAGGNMAAFLSYNEAKRTARDGATFGSGNPKGVAAAEAGNSADNGASLIPTLTLGVPGNAIAALIMGGLLVQGLQPGPALFRENATVVYGFMLQMLLTSALIFVLGGLIASRLFAQVLRMPQVLLAPMIVCLMVLGIYTVTGSSFNLYLMAGFGLLGYAMNRLGFPLPPLVLGAILGDLAEQSLRTALRIARGDWSYLLSSTVSRILIAVIVLMLLAQAVRRVRSLMRPARRSTPETTTSTSREDTDRCARQPRA